MARRTRWLPPSAIIFATGRTLQERFFLRPDRESRELAQFWVAKAQEKYPVVLYEFQFMSNHYHMLGADPQENWAAFMQYWESNLARTVNELRGRRGTFWADRYHSQHVLDEDAVMRLAVYTLTNPVKDGLVSRVAQWPGASSYEHAVRGRTPTIKRFDRVAWNAAGKPKNRRPFVIERRIELSPLPGLEDLTPKRRQALMRELIEARERELASERLREGRRVMGAARLRKVRAFDRPRQPKRSRQPLCHASSEELRRDFRERWREFNEAYRAAAALVRGGQRTIRKAVFPEGSFPPFLPRSWPEPG